MCYIALTPESKIKHIASEDMKVYKIIELRDSKVTSVVRVHNYIPHQDNPTVELKFHDTVDENISSISKGYHSYKHCRIAKTQNKERSSWVFVTNTDMFNIDKFVSFVVGEFIIPKGAEYYENSREEIVSNKIVFTGIIHKPYIKDEIVYEQIIDLNK